MHYSKIKILSIIMAATGYRAGGGMAWHPYIKDGKMIRMIREHPNSRYPTLGGKWVHNPLHTGMDVLQGAGIAASIGQGNFMTRNFRQKPIVGLETHKHIYMPPTKPADNSKNKILVTHKAMPYRRVNKKSSTRSKKSRRSYRKKLPALAIPRSRVVRFRQVFNHGLGAATGSIGTTMFKANSLNDPGGTATAILPLGLDQWAAQYKKYIVLGSKITVRGAWTSTANTGPCVFGIHLDNNNTALTSAAHYKMLPNTAQKILSASKDYGTVTVKYSGKKFWKLTNIKDDSEQEADFSTTPGDPTDIAYYHLFAQDINGSQTANIDFQVSIEFICLLTDPVTLAESSL